MSGLTARRFTLAWVVRHVGMGVGVALIFYTAFHWLMTILLVQLITEYGVSRPITHLLQFEQETLAREAGNKDSILYLQRRVEELDAEIKDIVKEMKHNAQGLP